MVSRKYYVSPTEAEYALVSGRAKDAPETRGPVEGA